MVKMVQIRWSQWGLCAPGKSLFRLSPKYHHYNQSWRAWTQISLCPLSSCIKHKMPRNPQSCLIPWKHIPIWICTLLNLTPSAILPNFWNPSIVPSKSHDPLTVKTFLTPNSSLIILLTFLFQMIPGFHLRSFTYSSHKTDQESRQLPFLLLIFSDWTHLFIFALNHFFPLKHLLDFTTCSPPL